jgi:hypothetical protein
MKYLIILSFLCCALLIHGQQRSGNDGAARMSLSIWIPDNIDGLTAAAAQNLHNKLSQIITSNGISANPGQSRFIITANVIMLEKHIMAGQPAKHLYKMDVTFYVGDGYEGKSFSSYNTTVTGIGDSETQAFNNAIRGINTNSRDYQSFIAQGKARIIDYFNSQCEFIIKGALTKANMQNYDDALDDLFSIPDVSAECWNRAMDQAAPIFQRKIDLDCKALLMEATTVWNARQNYRAAEDAGAILSMINPHAACFGEAVALAGRISKRVLEVDKREWQYHYERGVTLQQSMIRAYRDIGVAYGTNQRATYIQYKSLW